MPNVQRTRGCTIAGCTRAHLARGWCHRHYMRWKRHGDPLAGRDLDDGPAVGFSTNPCGGCGGPKEAGRGRALCNACRDRRAAERATADADRLRRHTLHIRYGVTPEIYAALLERQGGVCAICKGPPTRAYRSFDVDHDHATGYIRGLLCRRCNVGLAYVEDDNFREQALAYLEGVRQHA